MTDAVLKCLEPAINTVQDILLLYADRSESYRLGMTILWWIIDYRNKFYKDLVERDKHMFETFALCVSSLSLTSACSFSGFRFSQSSLDATATCESLQTLDLPDCKIFQVENNYIQTLPEQLSLPLCQYLDASKNHLTSLPSDLSLFECTFLSLAINRITTVPSLERLRKLEHLDLRCNLLTVIPERIDRLNRLTHFLYEGNRGLEIPSDMKRLLQLRQTLMARQIPFWNDSQNIHNSGLQGSVRQSLKGIMDRKDIQAIDSAVLRQKIIDSKNIWPENKAEVIESKHDSSFDETLKVTYGDVLSMVLQVIELDFAEEQRNDIYRCLNEEIRDGREICFTGKITRLLNSLNGFSGLVKIELDDSEKLATLVWQIKSDLGHDYTRERHRELLYQRAIEQGLDAAKIT